MFRDAVRYPTNKQGSWSNPLAVGAIVSIASYLLLPLPLIYGYYLRVLQAIIDGDSHPPSFDRWKSLYLTGVKAVVLHFVYFLIPSLIVELLFESFIHIIRGIMLGFGSAIGALLSSFLLYAAFWYPVPAALGKLSQTGRLRDGFAIGDITEIVMTREYITGWGLGVVFYITGFIGTLFVSSFLMLPSGIGPLLLFIIWPIAMFYITVSTFYLYGRGYPQTRSQGVEPREDPATATGAVPNHRGSTTRRSEASTYEESSRDTDNS
jgi:hypothetical protein